MIARKAGLEKRGAAVKTEQCSVFTGVLFLVFFCYNKIIMANENSFLKPEEKDFQTYYKREVWWLEHRLLLKKIALGIFVIFDACLVLFATWLFLDAYAISYDSEQSSVAALAGLGQDELRDFSQNEAARPLVISKTEVFSSGDENSFDLFATVTNPNSDWYATFKYGFQIKNGKTEELSGFILPSEERPFVIFKGTTAKSTETDLILSEVEWYRIDPHQIFDYSIWLTDRQLEITNAIFSRGDDLTPPGLSFTAANKSAYGFYRPSFLAVLWRGGSVAGVMRLSTAELKSGEIQNFSARWSGAVPAVSKIEIFPEINLLDPAVYLSPSD